MDPITSFAELYLTVLHIPKNILWTDIVEILIISILVYRVLVWARNTKAWEFLKSILFILFLLFLAAVFHMTTILWITEKLFSVAIIAIVVVIQPELRRALEQLGKKNFLNSLFSF